MSLQHRVSELLSHWLGSDAAELAGRKEALVREIIELVGKEGQRAAPAPAPLEPAPAQVRTAA